jgi:hypothetical protein
MSPHGTKARRAASKRSEDGHGVERWREFAVKTFSTAGQNRKLNFGGGGKEEKEEINEFAGDRFSRAEKRNSSGPPAPANQKYRRT